MTRAARVEHEHIVNTIASKYIILHGYHLFHYMILYENWLNTMCSVHKIYVILLSTYFYYCIEIYDKHDSIEHVLYF